MLNSIYTVLSVFTMSLLTLTYGEPAQVVEPQVAYVETVQAETCNDKTVNLVESASDKENEVLEFARRAGEYIVYNFNQVMSVGAADTQVVFAEALFGIRLETEGTTVTVTPYRHNETAKSVKSITINQVGENEKALETVSFNEKTTVDLKGQEDGLYLIHAIIDYERDREIVGYVFKEGNLVQTCCAEKNGDLGAINNSLKALHRWTDDLDPQDYLSLDGLTYPSAGAGYVDNVAEIAEFSRENFTSEYWNDETKVYAMVNWLNNNIAYDKWRTTVNDNHSRAWSQKNYTDPSIFCWQNHVGVCWDYTNILAIFCRAQGIPATSIDTDNHTWNIVYLNGQWKSIDVCQTGKYDSATYDGDRDAWTGNPIRTWSNYCSYPHLTFAAQIESVNDQMWTTERALRK